MITQYVGEFTEQDLIDGKNKEAVEIVQKMFPRLKYVLSKITKKKTMKIWITDTMWRRTDYDYISYWIYYWLYDG